jgi:FKBP-type peptidyl-prolyl cis-trans isomerase FklB
MKKLIMIALALLVAGASSSYAQKGKKSKKKAAKEVKVEVAPVAPAATFRLANGSDSLSYAAGYTFAEVVRNRVFNELIEELKGSAYTFTPEVAYQGLYDALKNDTSLMKPQRAEWYFNERMMAHQRAKAEQGRAAGKAWLAENAKKEGVITLPSGMQYKVIKEGNGPIAKADDQVRVKYEGRLIDGTVFDSTDKHGGEPITFSPNLVIPGWCEALTMMPVGSRWEVYIPENLAYGSRATGQIPAYSALIFDIEVVGIEGQTNTKKASGSKSKKKK